MYNERIVAGLDIGTTNIKVVVGRINSQGNLDIIGTGTAPSHGVIRGSITNIDKTCETIQNAIKEAEIASSININVVRLGLSDQFITSEVHKGSITRQTTDTDSEITVEDVNRLKSDMHRTLVPPGHEIVHVIPQTYTVDYKTNIKDPVGMSGVKLEGVFRIITASSNSIRSAQKCINRIGIHIDSITISPLAASLVSLSKEEKDAGVCIIDIGGGTADIAIFHESILQYISVLPLGSDLITADIQQACMIMTQQAELLKTKFGLAIASHSSDNDIIEISGIRNRNPKSVPLKTLCTIIEARMAETITLIHESVIKNKFQNKLSGGIVLVGGGANLGSITDLFETITGIETRVGHANESIELITGNIQDPSFTAAIGLVMNGFKCIDYRDEYYRTKNKELHTNKTSDDRVKNSSIFKKVWDKTRSMLIDDYTE
jgi:cell division protein FtsA